MRLHPLRQSLRKGSVRTVQRQDPAPVPREKIVTERPAGLGGQFSKNEAHGPFDIVAGGSASLKAGIDAPESSLGVQAVAQGKQGGGLAGLARCMHREVPLLPNES